MASREIMRLVHISAVVFAHHLCPGSPYITAYRTAILPYQDAPLQRISTMNPHFANLATSPLSAGATNGVAHPNARSAADHQGIGHFARMIFASIGALLAAIATWQVRLETYQTLERLSDKQLADIGLERGDISRVFDPDCAVELVNGDFLALRRKS